MATHSSVLAWGIPRTGEPGGVAQSQTQLNDLAAAVAVPFAYFFFCFPCLKMKFFTYT